MIGLCVEIELSSDVEVELDTGSIHHDCSCSLRRPANGNQSTW